MLESDRDHDLSFWTPVVHRLILTLMVRRTGDETCSAPGRCDDPPCPCELESLVTVDGFLLDVLQRPGQLILEKVQLVDY